MNIPNIFFYKKNVFNRIVLKVKGTCFKTHEGTNCKSINILCKVAVIAVIVQWGKTKCVKYFPSNIISQLTF